jgi:hypothetical protein
VAVEIESSQYFSIMNKLMGIHEDVLRVRELLEEDEEDDDEPEEDDDS